MIIFALKITDFDLTFYLVKHRKAGEDILPSLLFMQVATVGADFSRVLLLTLSSQ